MANGKHRASDDSESAKKWQAVFMETKVAIIKKLDLDEKMEIVVRSYSMNCLKVGTIYNNKDCIMEHCQASVSM